MTNYLDTIHLHAKVYKWTCYENVFVRGYIVIDNTILIDEEFARLFRNISFDEACAIAGNADGFFSIIVVEGGDVWLFNDHLSSMPLFYYIDGDKWHVCDSLNLKRIGTFDIDDIVLKQFEYTLGTIGDYTLCKSVHRLEGGSAVCLNSINKTSFVKKIWNFKYKKDNLTEKDSIFLLLDKGYEQSFSRLIKVLNGRTAVIPLSGGHDSRLIAFHLKKMGYNKIIAYSYGKMNNMETTISRRVAKYLDITHYFVEYDRNGMRKWYNSEWKDYYEYAGNASSVPCIQETYAVSRLKEQKIIPDNAVFIPGYTGDFLAGNHLESRYFDGRKLTTEKLKRGVVERHFNQNKKLKREDMEKAIKYVDNLDYLNNKLDEMDIDSFCELYERFDYLERQCKFIVNAVRTYEFYGYEWLLPEFDKTQFDTWLSISPNQRLGRKVFFEYEQYIYPKELNTIPFADDVKESMTGIDRLKNTISRYSILPWTRIAHFAYACAPISEYAYNVYIKRNRNPNHWVFCNYIKLIKTVKRKG